MVRYAMMMMLVVLALDFLENLLKPFHSIAITPCFSLLHHHHPFVLPYSLYLEKENCAVLLDDDDSFALLYCWRNIKKRKEKS